jgi:hypothetical protein
VTGVPKIENPDPDNKPDPDPTDSSDIPVVTETTKVTFSKADYTTGEELAGAQLAIVDPLLGEEVYFWTTDGTPHEVTNVLTAGRSYYLTEKVVPEGYLLAPDVEFTVQERFFDEQPQTVQMRDVSAADGTGRITAIIRTAVFDLDLMENLPLETEDSTFYVRLFTDQDGLHPYGDMKEVHIQNGSFGSVMFDEIPDGTYYVYETDASGKMMAFASENSGIELADDEFSWLSNSYSIILTDDGTNEVQISSAEGKTEATVDITNVYADMPDGFFLNGMLAVTKMVRLNGEQINVADTFYVGLFSDPDLETADVEVEQLENNDTVYISIPMDGDGKQTQTYWVYETDANGNKVDDAEEFAYAVSGETSVSFDTLDNGLSHEVTIINEAIEETVEVIDPGDSDDKVEPTQKPSNEGNGGNGNDGSGTSKSSAPKTGDDSNVEWYLLLLAAAFAEMALILSRKKQHNEE